MYISKAILIYHWYDGWLFKSDRDVGGPGDSVRAEIKRTGQIRDDFSYSFALANL